MVQLSDEYNQPVKRIGASSSTTSLGLRTYNVHQDIEHLIQNEKLRRK